MKKLIASLTMMVNLFLQNSHAQVNLVPNPSFEDTVACPTTGWISNSQGWESYSSSPDYYNSCAPSWNGHSVPLNFAGNQVAASGQAYAGVICYVEGEMDYSVDREILGASLNSPLISGQRYYVSFKVALALNTQNTGSSLAINKLGVLFSTVPFTNVDSTTIAPINNFCHVYTNTVIADSTNWTTIFGSFVADSAYSHIALGNFFKVSDTDTIHIIANNPFVPNAYYYLDDVCVSTDSVYCENYVFTGMNEENLSQNVNLYPNPSNVILNIDLDDNFTHAITICNIDGQVILRKDVVRHCAINIELLPKGIYFVQVYFDEDVVAKKLVIY